MKDKSYEEDDFDLGDEEEKEDDDLLGEEETPKVKPVQQMKQQARPSAPQQQLKQEASKTAKPTEYIIDAIPAEYRLVDPSTGKVILSAGSIEELRLLMEVKTFQKATEAANNTR